MSRGAVVDRLEQGLARRVDATSLTVLGTTGEGGSTRFRFYELGRIGVGPGSLLMVARTVPGRSLRT